MRKLDILVYAFGGLRERRLRSSLTILGIVVGSALIVALIANSQGLGKTITEELEAMGAQNILVIPASPTSGFRPTDYDVAFLSNLPGVKAVVPLYTSSLELVVGNTKKSVTVFGTDPTKTSIILPRLKVEAGDELKPNDLARVGVGYNLAHPVDPSETPIVLGQSITLRLATDSGLASRSFTVGTIYDRFGASLFIDLDNAVILSIPAARSLFQTNYYHALTVTADRPEVVDSLVEVLRQRYGSSARVIDAASIIETARNILGSFTFFLGVVASIALLVAGIGIANTMVMSVMERTREIGVLRALGFTKREVTAIFMAEAFLTGLIGGILGVLTGVALSIGMGGVFTGFLRGARFAPRYEPIITPELIGLTILFAIVVGVIAGLYPSYRASRIDPVKALKEE